MMMILKNIYELRFLLPFVVYSFHSTIPCVSYFVSAGTGKLPVSVVDLGVDLLSVCSHKFYGPKGVGALYIRSGITLKKLMHGAGHERCWRRVACFRRLIVCAGPT